MNKIDLSISLKIAHLILLLQFTFPIITKSQEIKTPETYFGFQPGADNKLFDYEQLISYIQELDAISDRLEMRQIGESPYGKPMYVAFFSSENNIKNLDKLAEINKELALNPNLTANQKA